MRDLIDRQAAIDALEEPRKVPDTWTDEYAVGERMQWEKDVKALNSLSPVQEQQWIPVAEKLPDADENVLVTCEYKGKRSVGLGSLGSYVDGGECWCLPSDEYAIGDYAINRKITAWMPLPEPYREVK